VEVRVSTAANVVADWPVLVVVLPLEGEPQTLIGASSAEERERLRAWLAPSKARIRLLEAVWDTLDEIAEGEA